MRTCYRKPPGNRRARRAARCYASRALFGGKNRQLEAARLGDLESAAAPGDVVGFSVQRDACFLGSGRELIDVLLRADGYAHTDTFLSVPPLLPVVLSEIDPGLAGAQRDAEQGPLLLPALFDSESQPLEERDALLEIVHSKDR